MVVLPIAFLDHKAHSVSPEYYEKDCEKNFDDRCQEDDRFFGDEVCGHFYQYNSGLDFFSETYQNASVNQQHDSHRDGQGIILDDDPNEAEKSN